MNNLNIQFWLKTSGVKAGAVVIAAWFFGKIGKRLILQMVVSAAGRGAKLSDSQKQRINTLAKVFSSTFNFFLWIIAILTILPEFGINIAPLLAGAGLAGLAIGMGAKNLIQDYLAGIVILLEDQYRIGEEINIAGVRGSAADINLRRTALKDEQGIMHFIPNGKIDKVSNYSRR